MAILVQQLFGLFFAITDYVPNGPGDSSIEFQNGMLTVNGEAKSLFDLPGTWRGMLLGSLAGGLLIFIAALLFKGNVGDQLGLSRPTLKGLLPWFLAAIGLTILSIVLPEWLPALESKVMDSSLLGAKKNPLLFLAVIGLAVPFFEELLFRGWLFKKLETSFTPFVALLVTSLLFTIGHTYNIWFLLILFAVALALGMLRLKSGSIWPSLLVHVANNTWAVLWVMSHGT